MEFGAEMTELDKLRQNDNTNAHHSVKRGSKPGCHVSIIADLSWNR